MLVLQNTPYIFHHVEVLQLSVSGFLYHLDQELMLDSRRVIFVVLSDWLHLLLVSLIPAWLLFKLLNRNTLKLLEAPVLFLHLHLLLFCL